MSNYEQTEFSRQLANVLRVGTITELDESAARVRVSTSGLTTDWLPWTASRAGNTRQWSPPRVGEQVLVASPYGDMGQALVIGSLYSDEKPAPAGSKDQEHIVFPDGSTVDYNSATHTMALAMVAAGHLNVTIGGAKIEASASGIKLTVGGVSFDITSGGIVMAGGTVTHDGKNIGSTHTHSGVQPGGSNTGVPT